MSLMLMGVLNMPLPDDPAEMDIVTWLQVKNAMRDAAKEIELLRAAATGRIKREAMTVSFRKEVDAAVSRAFEAERPFDPIA